VFVSAGTWVIAGVERPEVDTSPEARAANFSNEAGALGGFRFLRNVIGFWLLERCRLGWGDPPLQTLLAEAAAVDRPVPGFDVEDERFLAPEDMEAEIRDAAGIGEDAPRGVIVASALGSIATGVARIVADLETVTGEAPQRLAVVGGGAQTGLFHELLAHETGLPVVAGSVEATALGNAVVQGIALGRFDGLPEARSWLEPTGRRR
jgi:rhamnulokinase